MKCLLIVNTDGALYRFRKPIIKSLVARGDEVVTLSSKSSYFPDLITLGARPLELNFERHSVSVLKDIALAVRIYRNIKKESPDVVHNFTHKPAIYGTIASWLAKTPGIFVTITGLGTLFSNDDVRSKLLRLVLLLQYRVALKLVTKVFFQNPDDMALFIKDRIVDRSKAALTNGSGIDIDEFCLPPPSDISEKRKYIFDATGIDIDNKLVVLFTARGVREKGFFDFYEAAQLIHTIEPGKYVFIHLGLIDTFSSGFITDSSIREYAEKCGVCFLGFVENVRDYIVGSDIMVLPSVYREGTPHSLIEALALGKPIVTTKMPGCRETVVDGWNGFLCEAGNVVSLASSILRVDDQLIRSSYQRSRRLCVVKYDAKTLIDITLSSYDATLGFTRSRWLSPFKTNRSE